MTYVRWNNDGGSGAEPGLVTLVQWDGSTNGLEVKESLEAQIGNGITFPTPTVDFGTGECRFASFTWVDPGDNTDVVPAISIPVGAIVYAYLSEAATGFDLHLTTMEWLRLNGQVKAVY